jgi:hypothetical protein
MEPQPTLARFEIVVLKNKDANDVAQVPADSTIEFYPQGATIRSETQTQPVSGPVTLQVWHPGQVRVGDKLWRNGRKDPTPGSHYPEMEVTEIGGDPEAQTITVSFADTLLWSQYDRLVLAVPGPGSPPRPNAYEDPLGSSPVGTSIATLAIDGGWAACYLTAFRFDYTVNVAGEAPRVHPDAAGSYMMRG